MLLNRRTIWLPVTLVALLVTGCSDEPREENDFYGTINMPDSLLPQGDEVMMYTLPTPLQISSVLKTHNIEYKEDLLLKPKKVLTYPSSFVKALNLGFYTIDLGYVTVYERYTEAIHYAQTVKELMAQLGIERIIHDQMIDRFKNNVNNQDSLSKIILESYESAHGYFQQNGREGIGLAIATGCYIEGLYIASSIEVRNNKLRSNLLSQNKLFLENIIELLGYYVNEKEVSLMITELKKLQKTFDAIEVDFNESTGKLTARNATPELRKRINRQVEVLRNKYL